MNEVLFTVTKKIFFLFATKTQDKRHGLLGPLCTFLKILARWAIASPTAAEGVCVCVRACYIREKGLLFVALRIDCLGRRKVLLLVVVTT